MAKTMVIYYSLSGCTREVAEIIADMTGAYIEEIEMEDPYSKAGAYTRGSYDLLKDRLPILQNSFEISDADIIYIGAPVWFYTVPPPIRSLTAFPDFMDDIEGKTIIPFCTDGGNKGKFFEKMEELFPDAKFGKEKEFKHIKKYSPEMLTKEIAAWIKENQKKK